MSNDPLATLLDADQHRAATATALGDAHTALNEALNTYRRSWKAATSAGWAKNDLVRAGFIDIARLPRTTRPRVSEQPTTDE